jgi:hypothetical protein
VLSVDAQIEAVKKQVEALTRTQIIATAKAENAKIMQDDPRPAGYVRHVDGVEGAPEESVRDGGVIVYDYDRLDIIVAFALDTLRQISPVDKGDYVRSHTLFIDGHPVEDLSGWHQGQKVAIANTQPYARKIEVGGKKFRTHPHVYERATHTVTQRFGNIASISFGYMQVDIGDVASWSRSTRVSHRGHASTKTRDDWLRRQPAMFLSEL